MCCDGLICIVMYCNVMWYVLLRRIVFCCKRVVSSVWCVLVLCVLCCVCVVFVGGLRCIVCLRVVVCVRVL
jgi:hypothetical protein